MIAEQLIAHRGWQHRYPENTLQGINKAIEKGAKHIEIDIQLTSDHIPMLCHDQKLMRLCNSAKNINHCQFDELTSLSAYEPKRLGEQFLGTPLATLEQCIELISQQPQLKLYVEIKRQSLRAFGPEVIFNAVHPLLNRIPNQCYVISFDIEILHYFKRQQWQQLAPVLSNWKQAFGKDIRQLSPTLLFCDVKLLTLGKKPSDLPYPVAIYEINAIQQARQLLKEGAALIETFAIGELIDMDKQTQGPDCGP